MRKPLNSIRKRTAEHLVKSWTTAPTCCRRWKWISSTSSRRARQRVARGKRGFTLTYLPLLRAVSVGLAKFPLLNASPDSDDMVVHPRINLGIAVDLNFDGLVVRL
jgi:pyruvate/2-oxoglutarate dehydrogenase complex dihydrolipoamide acyltransferase (E2) component